MAAEPAVLLVTDDRVRSGDVPLLLEEKLGCTTVELGQTAGLMPTHKAVIFDVDLSVGRAAERVRETLSRTSGAETRLIFLADRSSHHARVQAAAFGSAAVLGRPLELQKLLSAIFGAPVPVAVSTEVARVAKIAAGTIGSLFDAVRCDSPLDLRGLDDDGGAIDEAIMQGELNQWISAVREHHRYTYRHCMLVAGVVAAFTQRIGIGASCRQRLMRGALLHDIGKAGIPVSILDKPEKLSNAELVVMRGHPGLGRAFLMKHHRAEDELIDIVYHHHEVLDGSGYPEGITAPKIKDTVRIITICDIFSALIEERPYKKPSTKAEAFAMMESMKGKLDADLLRAFKPVALA